MSPVLIKLIIWFTATFFWMDSCSRFKEKHKKEFSSSGKDLLFAFVKYGIPAAIMNVIGLADEIRLWLGIV